MKKTLMISTVVATSVLMLMLMLNGCGAINKFNDLHDATMDLDHRTQDLSNSTHDVSRKEEDLYEALRQGDSLTVRRDSLAALLKAQDSARKISEAAKYFSAFEFQLWGNNVDDNDERRGLLAALAAREFMRDVQEFMTPGQTDPNPLAQGDPTIAHEAASNRQASLNALSVAMHLTNPKQDAVIAADPKVPQLTIYSMIEDSLRAKKDIDAGAKKVEDFPPFVKEVLTYENVARLLLQVRFNFLGAMLLSQVSDVRAGDWTKEGLPYWFNFRAGKMRFRPWTIDLSTHNVVEIQEYTLFMTGALQVSKLMEEIGMTPKLDSNLHGILAQATYSAKTKADLTTVSGQQASSAAKAPASAPLVQAEIDFDQNFSSYRKY